MADKFKDAFMKKVHLGLGIVTAMLLTSGSLAAQTKWSEYVSDLRNGDTVTIASGDSVLLDVCTLELKRLNVFGELSVTDEGFAVCEQASLELETLVVSGKAAGLRAGSPAKPLTVPWTITLTGDIESLSKDPKKLSAMAEQRQVMVMMGAQLELYGISGQAVSWSSLDATARAGDKFITIAEPTGWQKGDRLVIASSNVDPREAEVLEISDIDEAGQSIWLAEPLSFDHFGEKQVFAGKTIDTRAEVGLLSHTIVIQGDALSEESGIGGNIMVMNAATERPKSGRQSLKRPEFDGPSSAVRMSGVELRAMGQRGRPGRYPLHWHLVDDGSNSHIQNTSIHQGFQRAVVMHGTDAVTVESVVGYHIPNHMFVPSEEGDEAHNRFINNLGVLSLPVAREDFAFPAKQKTRSEQSEERNSVFWLRSSFNELRGNRAAGSWRGQGFFLDHGGMNKRSMKYAKEASGSPELCNFSDNLAHSIYVGLGSPDLYTPTVRGFGLFTTKHDLRYARKPDRYAHCTLSGFRAYKTQNGGVWSENGTIIEDLLVTDSHIGVVAGDVIRDAVVVGQSKNLLNSGDLPNKSPSANPDRSRGGFVQSGNGGQSVEGRVFENLTCINLPTCFFAQTNKKGQAGQLKGASIDNVKLIATKQGFSGGDDKIKFSSKPANLGQFTDIDGGMTGKPGYVGSMSSDEFLANPYPYINRWGWEWDDTPTESQ